MEEFLKIMGCVFLCLIAAFLILVSCLSIERRGCEDALNVDRCYYSENGWVASK